MKRTILFNFLCLCVGVSLNAQVGINTTQPKAFLQIEAKNTTTPESTVGLGVPVLNKFPASSPTTERNGMLVYLENEMDTNAEGFYYWDAATSSWEYILDEISKGFDSSKTIVSGNAFTTNMTGATTPQSRNIPFTSINSIDASFELSSGGLKIGKTSNYYLSFSGGVFKTADNSVYNYTTEILINGIAASNLTSTNSAPGGTQNGRSVTFYIATTINLNKGDIITVRTTKTSGGSSEISVNTPFTLTLINMN